MAITAVKVRGICVPVALNLSQSTRRLSQRDYVYVEISDSDTELVGEGLSYVGTAGAKAAVQMVEGILAPSVIGGDPSDVMGLYARLYQEALMQGRRGMLIRCIAAIDIALWDLAAKKAGVPLASMLGGHAGAVPAYASGGYYRANDNDRIRTIEEEIEFNKSLGFADHKMKVGGLSVREDAERVRAAVERLDPNGRLALDANNAYETPAEAIHAARAFEKAAGDHGLWWFEEPLTPDNIEGHARINRSIRTSVATGEVHQTRHEFLQLLQHGAADIIQADVGVVGGITEWLTIARTASSFGVPVAPHWHQNIHVHLVAASDNGLVIEHFAPEKAIYNMAELMTPESVIQHQGGNVYVPDRSGIGWEFDPEKLDAYEAK